MPILVKSDDVRSGGKAKARHSQLGPAWESVGYQKSQKSKFCRIMAFLGLFGIGFANLSQKDPSFEKLSHMINPLTPGAFCEKAVSWILWWFLGWILAKLALI